MLGSFQCRGALLLLHTVGQGPAVLAAGVGRVGCFFVCVFFFPSCLSYLPFSNASSLGRWLDILKYCGLGCYNPMVVVSYYRRRACYVLVNSRSKPPQEQCKWYLFKRKRKDEIVFSITVYWQI